MKTADISDVEVLQAVRDARACDHKAEDGSYLWPYTLLEQRRGAPFKVAYAALERADKRGYVESGVSLRTCWLTPKGERLLAEGAPGTWEAAYEPNGYPRKGTPECDAWLAASAARRQAPR